MRDFKQEICQAINIDVEDYCNFQFEQAYNYLDNYIPSVDLENEATKKWWINALTERPVFWSWWVSNWEKRDAEFLESNALLIGKFSIKRVLYEDYHSIAFDLSKMKLPGRITNEAYELMVHKIIKKEVAHA